MKGILYCICRTKKEAERIAASKKAARFAGPEKVPVVVRDIGREWTGGPERVLWYVRLVHTNQAEAS